MIIGDFTLVAAPAEYCMTGVKTLIAGNEGVVCEKNFGPSTLGEFKKMEIFTPDNS